MVSLAHPIKVKRETRLKRWLAKRPRFLRRRPKQKKPKRRKIIDQLGWTLDRGLSVIAPIKASKRMQQRMVNELALKRFEALSARGFSGADNDIHRTHRWGSRRSDIDGFLNDDIEDLQQRCAELARDNPIAHAAIEGRVINEIGVGIQCQARIKPFKSPTKPFANVVTKELAEEINQGLNDLCERWSRFGVDKSRMMSLGQFQKVVDRSYAIYGEAFVLFGDSPTFGPLSMSMELIAPERVETPPDKMRDPLVRLGIQYSESGIVLGYYVRSEHPDDHTRPRAKWDYYPRFEKNGQPRMCHVLDPLFPGQSRGIPWLAMVMDRIKDLDDYWEAELINKQVEACFGIIIEGGPDSDSPQARAEGKAVDTDDTGTKPKRIEEHSPGQVHYTREGEQAKVIDPSRPGGNFAPFIELSLRSIAAALNYPYEMLAKNFFRTTYSSGRLAMLDGRVGFRARTQTIIDMWLVHVHSQLVFEAAFHGIIPVDFATYREHRAQFERHSWRAQNRGLLDPEKENKAHIIGLKGEIENKAGIAADRGENWEANEEQIEIEARRKIEREVRLAKYRMELEEREKLEPGASLPAAEPKETKESNSEAATAA